MQVLRISLEGRSGHSSNPSLGASALEGMRRVLNAVVEFRDTIQRAHRIEAFEVPVPTMNLGRIQGGDAPNRICASCELEVDLRALPGMDQRALSRELRERVFSAVEESGLVVQVDDADGAGSPPFETRADSEIVTLVEELTGERAGTVAFATEGPFFNQLGVETVVMGPGSIDVAHQPDEHLHLADITPAVQLIGRLIERVCVRPEG